MRLLLTRLTSFFGEYHEGTGPVQACCSFATFLRGISRQLHVKATTPNSDTSHDASRIHAKTRNQDMRSHWTMGPRQDSTRRHVTTPTHAEGTRIRQRYPQDPVQDYRKTRGDTSSRRRHEDTTLRRTTPREDRRKKVRPHGTRHDARRSARTKTTALTRVGTSTMPPCRKELKALSPRLQTITNAHVRMRTSA